MIIDDERRLFSIAQVSSACGISRTSLIRLEESGFLKPYRTDPVTRYRYYDVNNIVEIGRYKRMHAIGLTRSEITDIYHDRIDIDSFIETQRIKLNELQHFINEYELRRNNGEHLYSLMTLSDMTCCCKDLSSTSFRDSELEAYQFYEKTISEGYHIVPGQPPVVISDDWSALTEDSLSGCRFTVCIPVFPTAKQEHDPRLRYFPSTTAFSVSGFGGYSILPGLISDLNSEPPKRGLEVVGPARLLVLAASRSNPDELIFELIVPVKDSIGHIF